MIRLKAVSKSYVSGTRVLDKIDLTLKKGDFLFVVGGSGAGKSTLLRMIATEEPPSSGSLSLFEFDLTVISPSALRAIRQSMGYVPQNVRLIPELSVRENIAISLSLAGSRVIRKELHTRIDELMQKLGLWDKREVAASTLSGGEAQRVAIARALARQPELIIADEPTGAQDRENTWLVMDLLLKANLGGATVIVATHDNEIVKRVRKRCAILKGGRIELENNLCIY